LVRKRSLAQQEAAKSDFPKECCGVCKFSAMDGTQLKCYGGLPFIYQDEATIHYIRGAPVEALDMICHVFHPKEMA
jgi:hypothetical protein